MAASVASRYALSADGVGAARPGSRGSQVTVSRYALGAEGGGAARPGAYMCSPRYCARCLLGGVGMSKTSCAARCSRGSRSVQGVLRAPAEGEGGVAHRENLSAAASAMLERSAGTVAHGKSAARKRRRRRAKVSRRRRAGRAPLERRGRRVRVPRAFKRPANTFWWVVVVAATPNYRRLASPVRGKYDQVIRENPASRGAPKHRQRFLSVRPEIKPRDGVERRSTAVVLGSLWDDGSAPARSRPRSSESMDRRVSVVLT